MTTKAMKARTTHPPRNHDNPPDAERFNPGGALQLVMALSCPNPRLYPPMLARSRLWVTLRCSANAVTWAPHNHPSLPTAVDAGDTAKDTALQFHMAEYSRRAKAVRRIRRIALAITWRPHQKQQREVGCRTQPRCL